MMGSTGTLSRTDIVYRDIHDTDSYVTGEETVVIYYRTVQDKNMTIEAFLYFESKENDRYQWKMDQKSKVEPAICNLISRPFLVRKTPFSKSGFIGRTMKRRKGRV